MSSLFEHSRLLWEPLDAASSRVDYFRRMVNHKHGLNLKNYHELHAYSVSDYTFWLDLWQFLGIVSSVPPDPSKVLIPGKLDISPEWFPGARLNYAENLLCRRDDGIAVTSAREIGQVKHYSWRELNAMVRDMAAAMRCSGLQVGDRVAAIVTNSIDAIVLALATASIGGIFSSTAPDMGTQGVLDRYRQISPKLFFAETEVVYAGKVNNLLQKVTDVAQDLLPRGLQKVILLPSVLSGKVPNNQIPNSVSMAAFIASGDGRPLTFEQLPFSQPLFILYSSGTTGPPKCIVHSGGGVLLQNKKEATFSCSTGPDDTLFQFTTTGWMMWTYMIATLSTGARLVAYDGSPFHPDISEFMKFVSRERVTLWGTSPRFLVELHGRGIWPHDLGPFDSLRMVLSTGAVLTPPMYEWTQEAFGRRVMVNSASGGTDICAGFVTSTPALPIYSGEIQVKTLGMKVEIFDPEGNNIEHTGEAGELVCTRPHPSIPLFFWGDDEVGTKFRKAYFDMYPGIWRQGDFMAANPQTKGLIILGRSDGVLNPSGVRFGSAEIYGVLERFFSSPSEGIEETICVGQRRPKIDKDERVLLFIKMRQGKHLTEELRSRIKESIAKHLSRRHVPSYIFQVEDIPITVNGKKIEIAVKQIVSGSTLKPSGTVANPESLQHYYKFIDIEKLSEQEGQPGTLRSKL